jgi:hypothetical protein
MDEVATVRIAVRVPQEHAQAFLDALTGNDDDVVLAAEHAIRDRLDIMGSLESVELELARKGTDLLRLMQLADTERAERRVYGPRA